MTTPTTHPDWINPDAELVGVDGNAFAVMGDVRLELPLAGNTPAVVDTYIAEAKSADYDHLLQTSMLYAGIAATATGAPALGPW